MKDYVMERKLGFIEGVNATCMALVEDFTNPSSHLSREDEDNNRDIEDMAKYLADKLLGSGALTTSTQNKVEKCVELVDSKQKLVGLDEKVDNLDEF